MLVLFQSTLPRGSDTADNLQVYTSYIFQSTLPRGSDIMLTDLARYLVDISIHAPSRERL